MDDPSTSAPSDPPDEPRPSLAAAIARRRCPKCREKELRARADQTVWCGNCGEELGYAGILISSSDPESGAQVPRWAMVLAGLIIGLLGGFCVPFLVGIEQTVSVPLGATLGALVGAFTTLPSE